MKKREKICKFAENIACCMRRILTFYILALFMLLAGETAAQKYLPAIDPVAIVTESDGQEVEVTNYDGSAPLKVRFLSKTSDDEDVISYYEWRFYREKDGIDNPYLVRHEQETEVTFVEAGTHCVVLYAFFVHNGDTVASYDRDYWTEASPIRITVSDSKIEFPNAFSPNGDGINDIYKAKDGYRSIIEFHASIYNRWGQRIYQWDDPAGGWDGKFHGTDVKQGVYFLKADVKKSDGNWLHIRKDVNLLRGYIEGGEIRE